MIIEDDPAILDVMGMLFTRAGYITMLFPNGNFILKETFEIPDIFLIDKQLSGIDGLDICRHIRNWEPTKHLPVIILSANPFLHAQIQLAGANAFLEKPFSNNHLLQVVADLLDNG